MMQNAAYKTMIEPDAFKAAEKELNRLAPADNNIRKSLVELNNQISTLRKGVTLNDADPAKAEEFIDAKYQAGVISIRDFHATGKKVTAEHVKKMFDELGPESRKFGHLNVRKDVEDSITDIGIQRTVKNVLSNRDIFIAFKDTETGESEFISRKDNPELWDIYVGNMADQSIPVNAGKMPNGENAYFLKNATGTDYLYELDENKDHRRVIFTERDLIEGSKRKGVMPVKSIREGF
jgi:hypothetical protein